MRIRSWTDFKTILDSRQVDLHEDDLNGSYYLAASYGSREYTYIMDKEDPAHADQIEYETSYQSKANTYKSSSAPKVQVVEPEDEDFRALVTHDFCDKTTWYQGATQVTGGSLSGSGTSYSFSQQNIVDVENGKCVRENELTSYAVTIYDNGTPLSSGYTINYAAGSITFDNAPTGPVTADYYYAASSKFKLIPPAGSKYKIRHAELDFTTDVELAGKQVVFEVWAYDPLDLPNKKIYDQTIYKSMKDIIKIANTLEEIRAMDNLTNPVVRCVFAYSRVITLSGSSGAELHIYTKDDEVLGGEMGTGTLYTVFEDE